ncbi:hypothetical protein D3C72_2237430 [compost metagenome]
MARVAEHRLEVIDNAPAAAHAAGGDDDGRAGALCQVADHAQVIAVAVDGEQVAELERVATLADALEGFLVPERLQLLVDGGEAAGQR